MATYNPDFELLSESDLSEYRGRGLLFRHKPTGCEVFHLVCDDRENTFAFGFRTPSRDSTGAAHIVEHSVLCGSERYPVRDPFLVMARRSLATYLNALTYPDRTIYPASSAVEADYFNLMSIYGDAVFFPLLTEDTFLQEGHRLYFVEDGSLGRGGVVYNEMRGDYSSADSLTSTFSVQSLFEPGHPYSWDSGGDPAVIPSLSYEAFIDFWARHYNPANCRVFLYGDIATGKQLDFLAKEFLSRRNSRWIMPARGKGQEGGSHEKVADVPLSTPRRKARRVSISCPPEAGSEGTTSIIVNWLLPPLEKPGDALAMEFLAQLLMGHDGAPLSMALRESGLGDDISPQSGLDTNFREPIFSIGLRGSSVGKEKEIEDLILATLLGFVQTAPRAEELDAAFHSIAFASREIRRGSGTYGTRLMTRAYRSWIRGGRPEEGLSFATPLEDLRRRIDVDPGFMPELARAWLLDNQHRSTVTASPDPAVFEAGEASRKGELERMDAALSILDREGIVSRAALLQAKQSSPESAENLARLPRLRARDIPRTIDVVPRGRESAAGCPVSVHPLFTNDIVYLDLAFPLTSITPESMFWLPFLSRFITAAGLPDLPWDKTAALMARYSGGIGVVLEAGTPCRALDSMALAGGSARPGLSTYAIFRLKALAERFPKALNLLLDLLTGADTGDRKRLDDILSELDNDVISALVPAGNSFALARAGASWGRALEIDDQWRGMGQFSFLNALRTGKAAAGAAEILDATRAAIVSRDGLLVNLTANREDSAAALAVLESSLARLPARRGTGAALPGAALPGGALPGGATQRPPAPVKSEGYIVRSQVGYAAAACRSSRLGVPAFAHETVLAHLLTTGRLWDELRVKRGAYGASCHLDALEGVAFFSTYRDPRPSESLDFFGEALEMLARGEGIDADLVEEAVVGSAGRELKPLLPEERGFADFRREMYGIDDEARRQKRIAILETGPKEIEAAAARLSASYKQASCVLISRSEDVHLLGQRRADTTMMDLSI